ncbi:MAG: glycerate kinase [Vulcanimicrobiota bacterium]
MPLEAIFRQALEAVDPYQAVISNWPELGPAQTWLLAVGKAAPAMARACAEQLGEQLAGGVVLTKDEHLGTFVHPRLTLFEAAHPVPDQRGLEATEFILRQLDGWDQRVLVALSGGASSLLVAPVPGLTLADLAEVNRRLLASGATIEQVNIVRKHLSQVKGGQLALRVTGPLVTLALSDVVGSPADVIGSGPTVPDRSTLAQARTLADSMGLELPMRETPKGDEAVFSRSLYRVVGDNRLLAQAALTAGRDHFERVELWSDRVEGEARLVAEQLAAEGRRRQAGGWRGLVVASGETTVTLSGSGRGGRCQELALAFALAAQDTSLRLLAGASDGTDGPTDAAGAMVDGATVTTALDLGLEASLYLEAHDSYAFFERAGGHLKTGPTGTNVNDLLLMEC